MILQDQQIEFIEHELSQRGVTVPSLAEDLLDHFCCSIEDKLADGLDFEAAYHCTYLEVCPEGLREINFATKLILQHYKHTIMKKITFLIGFLSAFTFVIGFLFKMMHWPTANMLILFGGAAFGLIFLPMYFLLKYKTDQGLGVQKHTAIYIVNTLLTSFLVLAQPYKILDWPHASKVFVLAFIVFGFFFLPRIFLNWYKKWGQALPISKG